MRIEEGEFVINQKVPGWGKGKVLQTIGEKYRVFFENAGEKLMGSASMLEKVKVPDGHPVLGHITAETDFTKFRTYEELERNFLGLFPGGFEDPEYLDGERRYKVAASDFTKEALSAKNLSVILAQKDFAAIVNLAKKSLNKANLVFPNEKMALNDALSTADENRRLFSESLFYHLYSGDGLRKRFEDFASTLDRIGASKWTTATYFLHLVYPDKMPFMKPEVTKKAAEAFGYPLNYKSSIEWGTYNRLIDFAKYVEKRISSHPLLKPRDMIDIQGFMWCADPSKYSAKDRKNLAEIRSGRPKR